MVFSLYLIVTTILFSFQIILCDINYLTGIEGKFPKVKKLPNDNLFIVINTGIYIYNYNYSYNRPIYEFKNNEIIRYIDFEMTTISEFEINDKYFILCLTKGLYLYIYENNEDKFYNNITLQFNIIGYYYNLIPYKYENSTLQYIINFINLDSNYNYNINFFLCEINFTNAIPNNFIKKKNHIQKKNIMKKKKIIIQ